MKVNGFYLEKIMVNFCDYLLKIKDKEASEWLKRTLNFFESHHPDTVYKALLLLSELAIQND